MATALDMIKRSMRLIGALSSGETPTAEEEQDGIAALNTMLESWGITEGTIFHVSDANYTWTANQGSRTLGPTGDLVATRPARILQAFQRQTDYDYNVKIVEYDAWYGLGDKTTQSTIITDMWVEYGHPNITLHVYPVPTVNADLYLVSWQALQSFTNGSDAVSLPPGYQRAVEFNLALELAPEYDRQPSPFVVQRAAGALAALKRQNLRMRSMINEPAMIAEQGGGRYRIFGDAFR